MSEIKLKRKVVYFKSSHYLDDYKYHDFLSNDELKEYNETYDFYLDIDCYTNSDAGDIKISALKEFIYEAEKAGANYISIDYHCDHGEYDFYGSYIHRATDKELAEMLTKEELDAKKKKDAKIKALEEELKKLKGE